MVLYPDVQRRAQEEISAVIGDERLPQLSDHESLPYVYARSRNVSMEPVSSFWYVFVLFSYAFSLCFLISDSRRFGA